MLSLRGKGWLPVLLAIVWPALLPASEAVVRSADLPVLAPGAVQEGDIAAGETRSFRLDLAPGQRLLIQAEQKGADLAVRLVAADGRLVAEVDTPTDRYGEESLLVPDATPAGAYRIEIRAGEGTAGTYAVRVEDLPARAPEDRTRLQAERWLTLAGDPAATATPEGRKEGLAHLQQAAALFGQLGRTRDQARALFCAANFMSLLGDARQAVDLYSRALPLWAAAGDLRQQAASLTGRALAHFQLGESAEALADGEKALALQRTLGDRSGEAAALNSLCLLHHARAEYTQALSCYEEALRLFGQEGKTVAQGVVQSNIGGVYELIEPRKALAAYQKALELLSGPDSRRERARTLNNLAVLYDNLGELGQVLTSYDQALATVRELGDRPWEARILQNLGTAYMRLGEEDRARGNLEQALALRRELGDRRGEASTLNVLASLAIQTGAQAEAISLSQRALEISRALGDRRSEAAALTLLGRAQQTLGHLSEAAGNLRQAAEKAGAIGDRTAQGRALMALGRLDIGRGQLQPALATLNEALALMREAGDAVTESEALVVLAQAQRRLGNLPESRARAEEALTRVESLRTALVNPDLRASFLASRREAYELEIDLLMELDRREPGRGHARTALEASERGRSRSLLDLLREAGADIREGVDPALRERERSLVERLNVKAARRLAAAPETPEQRAAAERELQALLADLDTVQAEIRQGSPRYAALTQPQPLQLSDIQKLLGPDTLLLEYSLGEERSFLWAVDANSITGYELPPRPAIEAAARQVYDDLRSRAADPETARAESRRMAELSRLLLGPVAGRLADRRLVIVADGALHYVPFAALPEPAPAAAPAPLLARHEVVSLPSASVLAEQRRDTTPRRATPRTLAILADPVFDARDPRVAGAAPVPQAAQVKAKEELRSGAALNRLPSTRREAETIAALAPPGQSWTALDFAANRPAVLGGALAPYRLVHFATHGVIDARTPELSGLVLSLVDEKGRPAPGFLSLGDIYNLELGADLVVLSGCETALGREIRGEGLVGLTQGFLYAGARRVVASLWRVEDRATSELMGLFYRGLLRDGLRPAAALRQAQIAIAAERRWRDPYFWAPFVLQGDWD